ncbi:Gamma-tubulin complex component 5 [Rhizoclosmatium sp. JEL0117]|nr:Gamma-tubulin complex component 5 [Rhizoclosmatium sp. JEL0117]
MRKSGSQSNVSLATTRNIHRLVATIARASNVPDDSPTLLKAAKSASNSLALHSYQSANEDRVLGQYNGLIEKWDLFGESDKANAMKLLLAECLQLKTLTGKDSLNPYAIHQVLAFLLLLSNSNQDSNALQNTIPSPPASISSPNFKKNQSSSSLAFASFKKKTKEADSVLVSSLAFVTELQETRKNPKIADEQIWKEIMEAEPLEGDHWNSISYDEVTSDEDEDYIESSGEQISSVVAPESIEVKDEYEATESALGIVSPTHETMKEDKELVDLIQSQYWNPNNQGRYPPNIEFDLSIPSTLAPAIASSQVANPELFGVPLTTTTYISELDVIREVLYILSGLPAEMFQISPDGLTYKPKMIACLTHMTVETLESLLDRFAKFGTIVKKLTAFVNKVQSEEPQPPPLFHPCLQAITTIVTETLHHHQEWIVEKEIFYFDTTRTSDDNQPTHAASLIDLLDETVLHFKPLEDFYVTIRESGRIQSVPNFSPLAFINCFTSRVTLYQETCDARGYRWGLCTLIRILDPWFSGIETWWLDGEIGRSLGIICDEKVAIESDEFWASKFTFREDDVPAVLKACFRKVLVIGKCLVALKAMDPELLKDVIPDLRNGIFSSVLDNLAELLVIPMAKSTSASEEESPAENTSTHQISINENETSPPLLLFDRVWQPENPSNIISKSLLLSESEKDQKKANNVVVWINRVQKLEFNEQQLWRPFQENFDRSLLSVLEPKFQSVGKILTNRLLGVDGRLLSHLQTLQRVFLMTSGLLMGYIIDEVADKIRTGELWRRPGVLQSVFDASVAALEPTDDVDLKMWIEEPERVSLIIDETLVTPEMRARRQGARIYIKSLECVKVGYDVAWPLNCVITPKSLTLYNKAFVFLMQLSLARNRLDRETLSMDKKSHGSKYGWMRQRTVLRRKMKVFCEGMTSFAMTAVIQPAIDVFMREIVDFYDLDQLNSFHEAFVSDICDHFFLLNEKAASILNAIYKSLDLCVKFSDMCMRFDSNLDIIRSGKDLPLASPAQSPSVTPTTLASPALSRSHLPKPSFGSPSPKPRERASSISNLSSPTPSSPSGRKSSIPTSIRPPASPQGSGHAKSPQRPSSPGISRMKRASSFLADGGRASPTSSLLNEIGGRSLDEERIQKEIENEGAKFGAAVSNIYGSFMEVEGFVVNSVTALASHGMPKLAALVVFLRNSERG